MKKGGKRVLSLGGKSPKNRKKSKRRSKRGGDASFVNGSDETFEWGKLAQLNPTSILMTPEGTIEYRQFSSDPQQLRQAF